MRSRSTVHLLCVLVALVLGTVVHSQAPAPRTDAPGDAEISRAVARVKADPNMGGTRTWRTLRWRDTQPSRPPSWLYWLRELFRFIAQSARLIMWIAVVVLAALLVAYLVRVASARTEGPDGGRLVTPTHVRDLDIRPESLPADIGAAARRLWDRGDRRAALALLYRGLLSRLAHVYQVPIRDSTTEGDCLTLAVQHLNESRHQYSARLVRVWQRTVYGGAEAEQAVVYELCDGFAPVLDSADASAITGSQVSA